MFFIEEIVSLLCYVSIFAIKFDFVDNAEEHTKVKRNATTDE